MCLHHNVWVNMSVDHHCEVASCCSAPITPLEEGTTNLSQDNTRVLHIIMYAVPDSTLVSALNNFECSYLWCYPPSWNQSYTHNAAIHSIENDSNLSYLSFSTIMYHKVPCINPSPLRSLHETLEIMAGGFLMRVSPAWAINVATNLFKVLLYYHSVTLFFLAVNIDHPHSSAISIGWPLLTNAYACVPTSPIKHTQFCII